MQNTQKLSDALANQKPIWKPGDYASHHIQHSPDVDLCYISIWMFYFYKNVL